MNERLTSFVAIAGRGLLLLLLLFCGVTSASSQPLPPASIKLRLLDGPEVSCPAEKFFINVDISSHNGNVRFTKWFCFVILYLVDISRERMHCFVLSLRLSGLFHADPEPITGKGSMSQ